MKKQQFVVDAALLQELGERLIGKPAIALAELVKNSYDADATVCSIEFGDDEIVVSDDGIGMSENEFLSYWMRIGTTHKVEQAVSPKGRSLTGSKGIGRLSVQFLASEMTLESTAPASAGTSLYALVDWRNAVRGADLKTVNVEWETRSDTIAYPGNSVSGTRIVLRGLRNAWDTAAINDLGDDVWMLRSPLGTRNLKRGPEGFVIEIRAPGIQNATEAFDRRFDQVFSNWKARIRGVVEDGRSAQRARITVEFRRGYPEGSQSDERFSQSVHLPIRGRRPSEKSQLDATTFEILIFKPEGRQPGGLSVQDLRDYLARFGNVSVYDAGFRLPYYGSGRDPAGQDWLSIAADQGRRLTVSELLPERLQTQNRYMLSLPAPGRILGAVTVDTNHERAAARKLGEAQWLQIQPGRDRLHENAAFIQLRDLVRFSLDFYANRYRVLDLQASERERDREPPSRKYGRAASVLEENRSEIPAEVFHSIRRELTQARKASEEEETAVDRRTALLAPLASAGMVALALNHELTRESSMLRGIGRRLRRIAAHGSDELKALAVAFGQALDRLESIQELFAPLLSEADRAATDRLRVKVVVDQVVRGIRALMPRVKFITSRIPDNLRFPVGSFAEWNALIQNVLTNAWNAMLDVDVAVVSFAGGKDARGREWLIVSDTGRGIGVSINESAQLFQPFERRAVISDSNRSIAIGGQGLGLTIVRMIAHGRSAEVRFREPEEGFSTTFELSWKGASK